MVGGPAPRPRQIEANEPRTALGRIRSGHVAREQLHRCDRQGPAIQARGHAGVLEASGTSLLWSGCQRLGNLFREQLVRRPRSREISSLERSPALWWDESV